MCCRNPGSRSLGQLRRETIQHTLFRSWRSRLQGDERLDNDLKSRIVFSLLKMICTRNTLEISGRNRCEQTRWRLAPDRHDAIILPGVRTKHRTEFFLVAYKNVALGNVERGRQRKVCEIGVACRR